MNEIASILLAVYAAVGAIDGIYYHLWKYRLFAQEASRREHHLHTIHAALFAIVVGTLYLAPSAGLLLWAGLGAVAASFVVAILDVLEERRSREDLGGLTPREYALHAGLIALYAASVALVLAARPASAWSLDAPVVLDTALPALTHTIALNLLPGAALTALVHVVLGLRPVALRFARPGLA
ncbi:hypothetical protein WME95_17330 [Sorangium sp. So ce327]|uniref:hypothetical protein n=1 Tax=Sorangium sp. So ce327 TaxID=3133301 RepID=UPI003F6289C9